jgi:hypothetical protein
VVSFTPRPLYPRENSLLYPSDRRLGGPQSRSGRHGEVNIFAPNGTQTPPVGRPARIQSLYRLRYPGCNVTLMRTKNQIVKPKVLTALTVMIIAVF